MSDLHMHRDAPWDFEPEPDVFYICAGDISEDYNFRNAWHNRHGDHMFAILGNHDYYGTSFENAIRCTKMREVNGIKIAGATLWTDLINPMNWLIYTNGLIDSRFIEDLTHERMIETHQAHKEFLFSSEADIIVSHHTPSCQSIGDRYRGDLLNVCFSNNLDEQILNLKKPPKLWIHGHTHDSFDYMIGNTRVICHPRGYRNERNYYKTYKPLIIELE
jgi:Icc-related predicted phosphoesterase